MANSYITNLYPVPNPGALDERLTVGASIVQFATTFDDLTRYIALDVQDADCFVTYDGSNPTTSNGHRLYAGRSYTWSKKAAQAAKMIRAGSTSSIIHASQFTD